MPVVPEHTTSTLRVEIGAIVLHVLPDDVQTFANLLRRPPRCGLAWIDALDDSRHVRLVARDDGTELTTQSGGTEWVSWSVAVDVAGDLTGALGRLRLPATV